MVPRRAAAEEEAALRCAISIHPPSISQSRTQFGGHKLGRETSSVVDSTSLPLAFAPLLDSLLFLNFPQNKKEKKQRKTLFLLIKSQSLNRPHRRCGFIFLPSTTLSTPPSCYRIIGRNAVRQSVSSVRHKFQTVPHRNRLVQAINRRAFNV